MSVLQRLKDGYLKIFVGSIGQSVSDTSDSRDKLSTGSQVSNFAQILDGVSLGGQRIIYGVGATDKAKLSRLQFNLALISPAR